MEPSSMAQTSPIHCPLPLCGHSWQGGPFPGPCDGGADRLKGEPCAEATSDRAGSTLRAHSLGLPPPLPHRAAFLLCLELFLVGWPTRGAHRWRCRACPFPNEGRGPDLAPPLCQDWTGPVRYTVMGTIGSEQILLAARNANPGQIFSSRKGDVLVWDTEKKAKAVLKDVLLWIINRIYFVDL